MGIFKNFLRFLKKENQEINVVSLFDGIACGYEALNRSGINIKKYYAYEIDKYAIKIALYNHPDIIQMGSVVNADFKKYHGKIGLLMGGSPCQNLSIAGNKKGLKGEESKLFFEYLRALEEIKPKYFLLENNATMTKENKDIITSYMGVEPIYINSNLLSAQNRKRLYWTNIPNISIPKDKNLTIKDIVQPRNLKEKYNCTDRMYKKKPGTPAYKKAWANTKTLQDKSNTLTCSQSISNSGATVFKYEDNQYYIPTPIECERLQTLPDNYTLAGGGYQTHSATNV